MDIIQLLKEDEEDILSEINKYQMDIITNKSKLEDLIVTDTNYDIFDTNRKLIPYLLKKKDETFYVPLNGSGKIHLFNVDVDKSSENNYYITDSIIIKNVNESVDYNEYGLPSKKLYKINTIDEVNEAIKNFDYCEESYKAELASNIIHRCQDFDYQPRISSENKFFNYSNKEDIIEVDKLEDEFLKTSPTSHNVEEYDWLLDDSIHPIKSKLRFLLKTNKIGTTKNMISDHIDYSKYLQSEYISKGEEINYLIHAFNMTYLRRFIKTASNKLDNVTLAKLKLSNRFKELFIKTNNIGDELVFGVDKDFLALVVIKVYTNDIILIPLIDSQGVNKNNISALCLGDTSIKMRVRKLMINSKNSKSKSLTEGIEKVNDDVSFSLTCESIEEFESKLNSYNTSINQMLEDRDHEGVLEGLACLLCLHSKLGDYKMDKIESIEESRMCDNIIDKTNRLFKDTFSKAQKMKPVNFPQYCRESANIKALFNGDDLELSVKKQLRKLIL